MDKDQKNLILIGVVLSSITTVLSFFLLRYLNAQYMPAKQTGQSVASPMLRYVAERGGWPQ